MAKGPQSGLFNFGNVQSAVEEAISNLIIGETVANPYMLPSPPQSTEVDTGFDPSNCGPNCRLTFSLLVDVGAITYALFETVTASIIAANPDIRISRASEFPGTFGDVDVSFWLDSGTNTIHFLYDVDGGGKTVTLAAITTLNLELQEAP